MKKIILILLAILSLSESYGQLNMRIDSIILSRERLRSTQNPISIYMDDSFSKLIIPKVRVVATIENESKDSIWIRAQHYKENITIKFRYRNNDFLKYGTWYDGNSIDGLFLPPNKSHTISMEMLIPVNSSKPDADTFHSTYPNGWNWGRKKVSDRMCIQWFNEIVPSLSIIVLYDVIDDEDLWLISDPIDLDKVVFTTNLTAENSN